MLRLTMTFFMFICMYLGDCALNGWTSPHGGSAANYDAGILYLHEGETIAITLAATSNGVVSTYAIHSQTVEGFFEIATASTGVVTLKTTYDLEKPGATLNHLLKVVATDDAYNSGTVTITYKIVPELAEYNFGCDYSLHLEVDVELTDHDLRDISSIIDDGEGEEFELQKKICIGLPLIGKICAVVKFQANKVVASIEFRDWTIVKFTTKAHDGSMVKCIHKKYGPVKGELCTVMTVDIEEKKACFDINLTVKVAFIDKKFERRLGCVKLEDTVEQISLYN